MCVGTLYGYKVHYEDNNPAKVNPYPAWQAKNPLPANAARLRNLIHAANHLMSHILHFYHLAALDYVNPNVLLGGAPAQLKRPFLCPRYDDNYYITTKRILAAVGLGIIPQTVYKGDGTGILETLPGWAGDPGGAVNAYLTGQYLKALDIRRICHEMQAIFSGRAPQCSGWTAGGATATVDSASIAKYQALLNQVKAFVGEPSDFLAGRAFTYMFDVVAAAHLFPEYFWIGNAYGHFMSNGWGEAAGTIPLTGDFGGIFGSINNPDLRALRRGYKLSALPGPPSNLLIENIGESIANSRYTKSGVNYPNGFAFEHPWMGITVPNTNETYSWLKSPRYNIGGSRVGTHISGGTWNVFEVGPLARQVVNGTYWAGILTAIYPALLPVLFPAAPGPDCSAGGAGWGQALKPVYDDIPGVTGGPDLSAAAYTGDSILDRIAARATETRILIDEAQKILNDLNTTIGSDGYGTTGCTDKYGENVPVSSTTYYGYGMSEASRGALSHWISVKNGQTTLYQCVVPTTWNASPRDANGNEGPSERSLQGDPAGPPHPLAPGASAESLWIANSAEPIEVIRTTHSYDFCIACAVHLVTPKGDVVKVDVPALPG
jgi:hydrogenase large subunit